MSSHKLRHNKTCLNCGAFVEKEFCPKCGQKNVESRQAFHHVFTHFISDLLHYDSSFWRTARYLFFSPGKLSTEYMNGKRKSHANPFSLYIFVSFLAFFVPAMIPDFSHEESVKKTDELVVNEDQKEELYKLINDGLSEEDDDEVKTNTKKLEFKIRDIDIDPEEKGYNINKAYGKITSTKELEAKHQSLPKDQRVSALEYYFHEAIIKIISGTDEKKEEKAMEFFIHNLSKALFLYMPIFAFWMWLFHSKKKRNYFDSGVFTLHFFSFWLLLLTLLIVITNILDYWGLETVSYWLIFLSILYVTFYFFRANRNFYGEGRFVSNIKALILLIINPILILLVMAIYAITTIFIIYH